MVGVDSGLLGPAPEAHCLGVLTEGGQSWAEDEQRRRLWQGWEYALFLSLMAGPKPGASGEAQLGGGRAQGW